MKIVTLIENMVVGAGLVAEHGLSFIIDTGNKKILFDMGQTKNFALNAQKLGYDISNIDFAVISHGHYDHTGGLAHFIEKNEKAPIFLKKEAFERKSKVDKYIGVSPVINFQNDRFEFVEKVIELVENVYIFAYVKDFFPVDQHFSGFFIEENGSLIPDVFNDELFLVIVSGNGLTIISSCSHNGISNMVETAKLYFNLPVIRIIGGFHIKNSDGTVVQRLVDYFNLNKITEIHTCHCTGIEKFIELKIGCTSNVKYNYTGNKILI